MEQRCWELHLDSSLPSYDADAAELLTNRVLDFPPLALEIARMQRFAQASVRLV
jgi:hypothetical protein